MERMGAPHRGTGHSEGPLHPRPWGVGTAEERDVSLGFLGLVLPKAFVGNVQRHGGVNTKLLLLVFITEIKITNVYLNYI